MQAETIEFDKTLVLSLNEKGAREYVDNNIATSRRYYANGSRVAYIDYPAGYDIRTEMTNLKNNLAKESIQFHNILYVRNKNNMQFILYFSRKNGQVNRLFNRLLELGWGELSASGLQRLLSDEPDPAEEEHEGDIDITSQICSKPEQVKTRKRITNKETNYDYSLAISEAKLTTTEKLNYDILEVPTAKVIKYDTGTNKNYCVADNNIYIAIDKIVYCIQHDDYVTRYGEPLTEICVAHAHHHPYVIVYASVYDIIDIIKKGGNC